MKNNFSILANSSKSYFLIIFLFFLGICSFGYLLHKSIFLQKKIVSASLKPKFKVYHDYNWYLKQKKYFNGGSLVPVSFESKLTGDSSNKAMIMRNGLLQLKPNAKATILICHGFMSSKDDITFIRYIFGDYNVFIFDFRAHGECIENQYCTFGLDEKNDVIGAVKFLRSHPETKDKPIIVYGFSMGAVASILAQNEDKTLFNAAILDCPFGSTDDLLVKVMNKMKISIFGYDFDIPGSFVFKKYVYHPYVQELIKFILKVIANVDVTRIANTMKPISTKDAVKNIEIPMLFIACHNDDKAPASSVTEIYNNATKAKFKRLWISSGRKHFDAFFVNPEKYIYKMRTFVNQYLDGTLFKKSVSKTKEDPCIYCWV